MLRRFLVAGLAIACLAVYADAARRATSSSTTWRATTPTRRQTQIQPDRSGPLRTITCALRRARQGDRIVLAKTAEPYRESITLFGQQNSGTAGQPFVLVGNGATLDGSAPVAPDGWEHYRGAVFRFAPPAAGPQQLFLDGRPASRVPVVGVGAALPALEPQQWCYRDNQIYFRVDANKLPRDYALRLATMQTGVTLYFVTNVAILDLTVQGFQIDGINAANTARDVYLAGVIARGNGRSGITSGGASRIEIDACLVGNNGAAQVLTLPWSETQLRNSNLLGNTAPGWVDQGGRVYLGPKLVTGGLDEVKAEE